MTDNGTRELFKQIKIIVENYLNNRKTACLLMGTYNGSAILVNERLPVPLTLISGNLKEKLTVGDKVRLLRNDGGQEYFILEIIGKRYALQEELEELRREVL